MRRWARLGSAQGSSSLLRLTRTPSRTTWAESPTKGTGVMKNLPLYAFALLAFAIFAMAGCVGSPCQDDGHCKNDEIGLVCNEAVTLGDGKTPVPGQYADVATCQEPGEEGEVCAETADCADGLMCSEGLCSAAPIVDCGEETTGNSILLSPGYPSTTSKALTCTYTFSRSDPDVCQIRVDFIEFELKGPSSDGTCLDDQFTVASVPTPTIPTICGRNTGQHSYLDIDSDDPLEFAFELSSDDTFGRSWKMLITEGCKPP